MRWHITLMNNTTSVVLRAVQQGPNSEGKSIGGRYPGGPWKKTLSVPGFCSTSCIHFVSFGVPRPLLIRLQVRRRTDLFWTFSPDAIDLRAPSASRLDALALRRRCPCARRVASSVAVLTDCNCAVSRARCTASAIVAASALNELYPEHAAQHLRSWQRLP